ncbi:MAG: hypothetical protein D6732_09670 [Methanobacteriota archaeon]|nr:MAG: hypothetical protein D6732_09670 [Euryarchaeota archaeon]
MQIQRIVDNDLDENTRFTETLTNLNKSAAGLTFRLPSAPEFMCIMKCKNGKPVGLPIWKTFQHQEGLTIANETISATFLSLSQRLSMFNPNPNDSTIIKLTIGETTYSVYLPSPDDTHQFAFVVAFEKKERVKIADEDRHLLVRKIVDRLKQIDGFASWGDNDTDQRNEITIDHPLYKEILEAVSKELLEWDQKRVKYLEEKVKKDRKALHEIINKMRKEQEEI